MITKRKKTTRTPTVGGSLLIDSLVLNESVLPICNEEDSTVSNQINRSVNLGE